MRISLVRVLLFFLPRGRAWLFLEVGTHGLARQHCIVVCEWERSRRIYHATVHDCYTASWLGVNPPRAVHC